jgi:hypothetical protein
MTFLAYIYVRAWIEFVRLIYVRWIRRAEFIANVGLPPIPEPASNSAISREHLWLFILTAVFSMIIIRCAGLDPSVISDRGPVMALTGGMLGLVGTVFWCWVVRVQEPYLPFD